MDNASEDIRKKRDSAEVAEEDHQVQEEKPKKLKAVSSKNQTPTSDAAHPARGKISEPTARSPSPAKSKARGGEIGTSQSASAGTVWDLESALHHVAQMGDPKEYLSKDKYISFRVGHAGDASALESLYRSQRLKVEGKEDSKRKKTSSTDDSSLGVWLADGFGGEDTPPSVFGLFVDYNTECEAKLLASALGAAALLTVAREDNSKVLRVEWLYIDRAAELAEIIERRLWLRLCTLSLLTSCEALVVKEASPKVEEAKGDEN